jgi:hypothetical protein
MNPQYAFPCNARKEPRLKEWQRKLFQWQEWKNAELVGVQTGSTNGFDVLDVDGSAGLDWYDRNFDAIPETWAQSTRRGMRLFFRAAPGLRCSISGIAPGIDVRAGGGYVIWWRREGLPYEEHPISEWPDWLLEEARKTGQRKLRTLSTIIEERSGERVGGNASALAALHQLDPRVFNGEDDLWFNFLMGAKCVGISEDDFVDWSIGDPDYWDHGDEIRRRWNSVAGLHAGAFYATLKQADIKLQPTKPTTKYNSAEGSQSAKAPFHHYSTIP